MPRISRLFIFVCAASFASTVYAECPYPERVKVPDGATATTEQLVDAQSLIKKYMAEMEGYLECLDLEDANLGREPTAEEAQMHNQRHNAAVDEMESVAADFNEQVRAYKKQNP
ncbi:MAG: hypothetical protein HKN81_11370 [Gammaproteobacteria bacterium]|nr:hypothetical protein [Gammaproteobacteria bacterium]NND37720.1 hypothetical protein [Gammaproteobacteria bacterium]